jgi:hypothetical protein
MEGVRPMVLLFASEVGASAMEAYVFGYFG